MARVTSTGCDPAPVTAGTALPGEAAIDGQGGGFHGDEGDHHWVCTPYQEHPHLQCQVRWLWGRPNSRRAAGGDA
jgi:hypothetical protein